MSDFHGAEPIGSQYLWRRVCDLVLVLRRFSPFIPDYGRWLFAWDSGSPIFRAFVVFWESVFSAVVLAAEGAFERENNVFLAVLALHGCFHLP